MTLITALGAIAIALFAFVLACTATVAMFRFIVQMFARRCPQTRRLACAAGALASFAGIFVIGVLGVWGASALLGLAG